FVERRQDVTLSARTQQAGKDTAKSLVAGGSDGRMGPPPFDGRHGTAMSSFGFTAGGSMLWMMAVFSMAFIDAEFGIPATLRLMDLANGTHVNHGAVNSMRYRFNQAPFPLSGS